MKYVDGVELTLEENNIITEYQGFDITDDDIVRIFRLGVAKGRQLEAALTPQSVSYEH